MIKSETAELQTSSQIKDDRRVNEAASVFLNFLQSNIENGSINLISNYLVQGGPTNHFCSARTSQN